MSRLFAAFAALILLAVTELLAAALVPEPSLRWVVGLALATATIPSLLVVGMLFASGSEPPGPEVVDRADRLAMSGPLFAYFGFLMAGGRATVAGFIPPEWVGVAGLVTLLPLLIGWSSALAPRLELGMRAGRPREPLVRALARELRPIALVLGAFCIIEAIGDLGWAIPGLREAVHTDPWIALALIAGIAAVILGLSPQVVRLVYPAQPFPPGPQRDRLEALARSAGVRVRRIYIWRTGPRPTLNACVTGVLPQNRTVFITDGLWALLPEEELAAVFAHELAHGAKHHLWTYAGLVVGLSGIAVGLPPLIQASTPFLLDPASLELGVLIGLAVVFYRSFGRVSRHFERQADLYSADRTGSPFGIIRALQTIGVTTGTLHRGGGWRHPSIPERIGHVVTCFEDPQRRAAFAARTRRILLGCAFVLALGALGWGAEWTSHLRAAPWELSLDRGIYLTDSHRERSARPGGDPERIRADLERGADHLVAALRGVPADPAGYGLRASIWLRLAYAYDELGDHWSAAAALAIAEGRASPLPAARSNSDD